MGEQHQRRHDLDPVYRDRERVRAPADLAMDAGKLSHMRIRDRPSNRGQPDDGRASGPDDRPVHRAHRAPPDRDREVGSDSETVASITS